jgi:hypothetical protein
MTDSLACDARRGPEENGRRNIGLFRLMQYGAYLRMSFTCAFIPFLFRMSRFV